MATLRERKTYRDQVLRVLNDAVEGNRLLGITGARERGLILPDRHHRGDPRSTSTH
ncbi:hypothetical protein ABZ725_28470 [Streptomyces sp. NPDC006872]|uniref:hypothetical protein n=1 Tax=Streptomyces sp. NPDC006872 TaxID=3155720 RepID=UPI0033E81C0F